MNRLTGKTALVTGGGQGVGQGIALALCAEGARVAVAGRTLAPWKRPVRKSARAVARHWRCSATSPRRRPSSSAWPRCWKRSARSTSGQQRPDRTPGPIAGGQRRGLRPRHGLRPLATLRLMRACQPYLRGGGVVVNLASSAAVRWDACGYGAYAAAKEAIRCLSRAAACEWGLMAYASM